MGDKPWNENEGKYDRPSSSAPKTAERKPVAASPDLTGEQARFAYHGIEPIDFNVSAGSPESTGQEPGSTETTERLHLAPTPEERADTSEQALAPAGCDGPADTIKPTRLHGAAIESHEHKLLRSYVERRERLEDEMAALRADRGELMKAVKASGFDRDIFEMIIRRRKLDPYIRESIDSMVALYEEALGMRAGSGTSLDAARDERLAAGGPPLALKKKPTAKDLAMAEAIGWAATRH